MSGLIASVMLLNDLVPFFSFERNADLYVHTTPLYPVSMQGGRGLVKGNGGISYADTPSIRRSTELIVVETRESRVVMLSFSEL